MRKIIKEAYENIPQNELQIFCDLNQKELLILKIFLFTGLLATESDTVVNDIFTFIGLAKVNLRKVDTQPRVMFGNCAKQRFRRNTLMKNPVQNEILDYETKKCETTQPSFPKDEPLIAVTSHSTNESCLNNSPNTSPMKLDWALDQDMFNDFSDRDSNYEPGSKDVSPSDGENSDSLNESATIPFERKRKIVLPRLTPSKRLKRVYYGQGEIDSEDELKTETLQTIKAEQSSSKMHKRLTKMKKKIHRKVTFPCILCNNLFSSIDSLLAHCSEVHPDPVRCKFCDDGLFSGRNYTIHCRKLHYDKTDVNQKNIFKCHFCEATFSDGEKLDCHHGYIHSGELKFNCKPCKKLFATKLELTKHNQTYHLDGELSICHDKLECLGCTSSYEDPKLFEDHIITCHLAKSEWPLKCSFCEESFISKNNQKMHLKNCYFQFKRTCDMCNVFFTDTDGLYRHLKQTHGIERFENYCTPCNKSFAEKDNLIAHMKKNHHDFETCDICRVSFSTKERIDFHKGYFHSSPEVFQCAVCSKVIDSLENLMKHVKNDHTEKDLHLMYDRFRCKGCDFVQLKGKPITKHLKKCHLKKEVTSCSTCGKKFVFESDTERHVCGTRHLKISERGFSCQYCGKCLSAREALQSHIKIIHERAENEFHCTVCGFRYPSEQELLYHQKGHWRYGCEFCGLIFPVDNLLKVHKMVKHSDEKPYQCLKCDVFLETKEMLSHHWKEKHNTEFVEQKKSIEECEQCEQCGWKGLVQSVRRHIQRHHIDKGSKVCETCGKAFDQSRNLIRHRSVHLTAELFSCAHCNKKFKRRGELNRHINIHTKENSYNCDLCSKVFYMKESLYIHRKRTHGKKSIKD